MQLNGSTLNGAQLNGANQRAKRSRQTEVVELADSARWRLRVLLAGVDVSARLTGTVTIDREEGAARFAKLSLLPPVGPLDLDQYTGKPLQVFRQRVDGMVVAAEQLRFTGETLQPELDAFTKLISLTASCGLQNRVEQKSRSEIDALLPGSYWSSAVFGELDTHWQYCQDRCSTIAGSLDSAPDGALRYTAWQPRAIPHFRFTASEIVDASVSVKPADAGQLINQIELTVEYRYSRLRHRTFTIHWAHPAGNFCTWLTRSTELPTESMLLDAIDQGGWTLTGSPQVTTLPPSMVNPCGGQGAWLNTFTDDPHLLSFSASMAQRISQTLTERYVITITAPGSVESFKVQADRDRYSDEVDFDSGAWEAGDASVMPGPTKIDQGDRVVDLDEPARRSNVLMTALNVQKVRVLASHRQTRLEFQTPIVDAVYDTNHTIGVELPGLQAQGKIARVQESWEIDSGCEIATIELAISRGGEPVVPDAITPPGAPVFDFGQAPSHSAVLATQLGGSLDSPPFDDTVDGFSGNYSWLAGGAPTYPRRLQFTTPVIDGAHRDPVEAEARAVFRIEVPTDLLSMEVL